MRSSIVVIYNPVARRASARKVALATAFLRERGFSPELFTTEKKGDAESFAREAARKNPFAVIAAGGDGTVNEVVNGIVWSDTPLALLPLGTTNVLAREIGIPENIPEAMEKVVSGTPRKVSLGRITLENGVVDRYFCLMAGIGFDAQAVHGVNSSLKKLSGRLAYVLSGFGNFLRYSPGEITLDMNGEKYPGYTAVISKASKYGGQFMVSPEASLHDPSFHVCVFSGGKRLDLLRYVLGVVRGRHLGYHDVKCGKTVRVVVRGKAHIQIDGDYLGVTPAELTIAENALRIIY
jgi:YegS/Rv2252/BmrU family lipid kinase